MAKNKSTNLNIEVNEAIKVSDEVRGRTESDYLIISNKEKCRVLLNKDELGDGDIMDLLIALHLVLEVSLNTLFRHLSLMGIKKDIDEFEIIKNIDAITFIDKTVLFIYNSKFNLDGKLDEASKYHSIIGSLRNFAGLRNQLLHGHSVSAIFTSDGVVKQSQLKKSINQETVNEQIDRFSFILEGMRFYLDCLDSSLTDSGKETFKQEYLDDSFSRL